MTAREVERLQAALRRMLGCRDIVLEQLRGGGTVQARVAGEIVGTVDAGVDEDEPIRVFTGPIWKTTWSRPPDHPSRQPSIASGSFHANRDHVQVGSLPMRYLAADPSVTRLLRRFATSA